MNYDEAIAYLLTFADFERSGRFHERPDLAPVLALLAALGDPHAGRPTVHITGSKGKGSVAAMIGRTTSCPAAFAAVINPIARPRCVTAGLASRQQSG